MEKEPKSNIWNSANLCLFHFLLNRFFLRKNLFSTSPCDIFKSHSIHFHFVFLTSKFSIFFFTFCMKSCDHHVIVSYSATWQQETNTCSSCNRLASNHMKEREAILQIFSIYVRLVVGKIVMFFQIFLKTI